MDEIFLLDSSSIMAGGRRNQKKWKDFSKKDWELMNYDVKRVYFHLKDRDDWNVTRDILQEYVGGINKLEHFFSDWVKENALPGVEYVVRDVIKSQYSVYRLFYNSDNRFAEPNIDLIYDIVPKIQTLFIKNGGNLKELTDLGIIYTGVSLSNEENVCVVSQDNAIFRTIEDISEIGLFIGRYNLRSNNLNVASPCSLQMCLDSSLSL